ncbi:MAG: Tad domain-containing protein [Steroidobacteraceae bacterium]
MIIIVAGLLAILAMAGLALDGGHLFLNKTRLQNMVDAAALAGAKSLQQNAGNTAAATAAARNIFRQNLNADGHAEIDESFDEQQLVIEFSETIQDFVPGSDGPYVRVTAADVAMDAWLIRVLGFDNKAVRATAVAGPSVGITQKNCNIIPVMICGDVAQNPEDPASTSYWGYQKGTAEVLKTSATPNQDWTGVSGPGNFHLLDFGSGASTVRELLAGSNQECLSTGDLVTTETGNNVGPTAQGLNTRFGQYAGPVSREDYPPDVITKGQSVKLNAVVDQSLGRERVTIDGQFVDATNFSSLYSYDDYLQDVAAERFDVLPVEKNGDGQFDRRKVVVPIGDCESVSSGKADIEVLGLACFFLLDKVEQQGNSTAARMYGEFIEDCTVNGMPGVTPGPVDTFRIQLYDDPDSRDS